MDAFVLNLVRTRTFSARDFAEARDGSCRLSSALTHELAPTMTTWAKQAAPYAEAVARHVARLAKSGLGVAAPIRPSIESDRARVKVHFAPIAPPASPKAARTVPIATASNACRDCGVKLTTRKRVYCDDCYPDRLAASRLASNAAFRSAGQARLKAMRAAGFDPGNDPEAQRRRAAAASKAAQSGRNVAQRWIAR